MGALDGTRVIDLSRLAPGPYCSMLLADMGAEVVRVDTIPTMAPSGRRSRDPLSRGKKSVCLNLKDAAAQDVLLRLAETADVFLEGFRPGVTSRLGCDYGTVRARNPRIVYCALTGWGQDGPYASMAGHDINYIAIGGPLGVIGRAGEAPLPPQNLVADFAGGGLMAAFGILAALLERERSAEGQFIDAAMVDGALNLTSFQWGFFSAGVTGPRGTNLLDTGAPFYEVYECADGRYFSVGAIEPQFHAELYRLLEIDPPANQMDRDNWPAEKARVAARFQERARDDWEGVFSGTDACAVPVLEIDELPEHPANKARGVFVETPDGQRQPAPAPRLGRTPGAVTLPAPFPGEHTDAVLGGLGLTGAEIAALRGRGAAA